MSVSLKQRRKSRVVLKATTATNPSPRAGQATWAAAHLGDISRLHRQHRPSALPGKDRAHLLWVSEWVRELCLHQSGHFRALHLLICSLISGIPLPSGHCRKPAGSAGGRCWCQRGHEQVKGVLDTPNKARHGWHSRAFCTSTFQTALPDYI